MTMVTRLGQFTRARTWQHIDPTIDYLRSGEARVGPDTFRPLREAWTLRTIAAAA